MTKFKKHIFDKLQAELKASPIWIENKEEISALCVQIPELYTNDNFTAAIGYLVQLQDLLTRKGFNEQPISFITAEIEYLEQNYIIAKYQEKDDFLSDEIINRLIQSSPEAEGIMGIKTKYNLEQLKKISRAIYNKTQLLKFFISRELEIRGKITYELNERAQDLATLTLLQSLYRNKETGDYTEELVTFGESYDKKKWKQLKEIKAPFYIYNFISQENKEYILYSSSKLTIGDYNIFGMVVENDDYKLLSESYKIKTKIPQIFVQEAKARMIEFKNNVEFKTFVEKLKISKDSFYDYPFTIEENNNTNIVKYQDWFKELIWAWTLHQKKGRGNPFPMHIMIAGPKGTGKSMVCDCLHPKSGEISKVYSGSSSTMKNLIPSFTYKPAKPGYLAESNRFAYVDEFLRSLSSVRNNTKSDSADESVGAMNDLLEHRKREAGSGISKISINMTARVLATTNPVKGIVTMDDMLKMLDESFLSRWIIYIQGEEDVNFVNKCKIEEPELFKHKYDVNDYLSIIDYLQSFSAVYDKNRMLLIFNNPKVILSEKLLSYYEARYVHHIECLLDGIIKTRCLMQQDMNFSAQEVDYENLSIIWSRIIRSWINSKHVKNLPIEQRIYYLPSNAQYVYSVIARERKILTRDEIRDLLLGHLHHTEMYAALIILIDNGLIFDLGENKFCCYWYKK
jgi:hypothetical protein